MQFVLIHGGWHDGSGWDQVAGHLRRAGHEVAAPTLNGHGHGVDKTGMTHAGCTGGVVDLIRDSGLSDVILVGHSYGGSIIQKVAEAVPDRLRRLVFYNAFVLLDGQCLLDENPPHYRALVDHLLSQSPDDSFTLPFEVCREAFFNSVELGTARELWETHFSPQPVQPFRDKLDLKAFFNLDLPRSYLNCTEDIALPPGPETGWHPRMSNRLGLYRLVQMPGDHEALLTSPGLLAEKLIEAGRD
ncbi:MAG: alpha/beta hydrolase [Gammaproteobacteria bacterium]|nr:alpha/beta hydrolase [Gammaproteobacteria bacterium]MYL01042.1 alpha/beta hydrolase [Gammaproteobacteria bacterium]